MVEGTINGFHFQAGLEPDGNGSHWFRVNKTMREAAGADAGDTVTLAIEPTREWPEPKVPADLKNALTADPQAHTLWMDITPVARWDWIRWIGSTPNNQKRVDEGSRRHARSSRPGSEDRVVSSLGHPEVK